MAAVPRIVREALQDLRCPEYMLLLLGVSGYRTPRPEARKVQAWCPWGWRSAGPCGTAQPEVIPRSRVPSRTKYFIFMTRCKTFVEENCDHRSSTPITLWEPPAALTERPTLSVVFPAHAAFHREDVLVRAPSVPIRQKLQSGSALVANLHDDHLWLGKSVHQYPASSPANSEFVYGPGFPLQQDCRNAGPAPPLLRFVPQQHEQ